MNFIVCVKYPQIADPSTSFLEGVHHSHIPYLELSLPRLFQLPRSTRAALLVTMAGAAMSLRTLIMCEMLFDSSTCLVSFSGGRRQILGLEDNHL